MLNFIVDYKDTAWNDYHRVCQVFGAPADMKYLAADQMRETLAASGFRVQGIRRVPVDCTLEELDRAADGPASAFETLYVSPECVREAQRRA